MNEKNNSNTYLSPVLPSGSQCHSQGRVLTDELDKVKKQIGFERLLTDQGIAHEICLIIAEMNCLADNAIVQIRQTKMTASTVREIYSMLRLDHVQYVIGKYKHITYTVRFPKSYFRTALYNAVFELNSRIENDANVDTRGF